ncbi:MAG: alpha/beta hydrolase [Mangrovibacterium sp.]
MRKLTLVILTLMMSTSLMAQDYLRLPLWTEGAPKENKATNEEEEKTDETGLITRFNNISKAELFVSFPDKKKNTGAAIVICPGGGYGTQAAGHEGFQLAEFLNAHGITAIVLKYRLPYGDADIPLMDGQEAIRYVRSMAKEWALDANKIGIAGSSAGGHLAAFVSTQFGNPIITDSKLSAISCRPDFSLLIYPVISFDEEITHVGSRKNLIGETNDWKVAKKYSNELHVSSETPPTFLVLADDDGGVVPQNSIRYYLALKENKIPAEMHIYAKGGHGFGMRKNNIPTDKWADLFVDWLELLLK